MIEVIGNTYREYDIKEYPIGTQFSIRDLNGIGNSLEVETVEVPHTYSGDNCELCAFNSFCQDIMHAKCCYWERDDEKDVVFIEINKVDEVKKKMQADSLCESEEPDVKDHLSDPKEQEFYMNCAISAMQGIQESGNRVISDLSEVFIKETAKRAFDMADAMLEEYKKRINKE